MSFPLLGSCVHFFVDIAKELLVLYENVYEIYGDIRGASNSFDYKFYAQGTVWYSLKLNCMGIE